MDKNNSFASNVAGYFVSAFKEGLKERDGFGIKQAFNTVKDSGAEAIGRSAADLAITETDSLVAQLKEDSMPIIAQTAEKLSPDARDSWKIIREQVAPSGGFFKTIFARLLWIGAKITSFIGASIVDQWTGRGKIVTDPRTGATENDFNILNLNLISSWVLGWMFKKPLNPETNRSTAPTKRAYGIPKGWIANAPMQA